MDQLRALIERLRQTSEFDPAFQLATAFLLLGRVLYRAGASAQASPVLREINAALAAGLRRSSNQIEIRCADFLACNDLGTFDRILMNPPFANAMDIWHFRHAAEMLRPGGGLVALCANGPRQGESLRPLAESWEDLPPGTFKEAGMNVRVALLVIRRGEDEPS